MKERDDFLSAWRSHFDRHMASAAAFNALWSEIKLWLAELAPGDQGLWVDTAVEETEVSGHVMPCMRFDFRPITLVNGAERKGTPYPVVRFYPSNIHLDEAYLEHARFKVRITSSGGTWRIEDQPLDRAVFYERLRRLLF